MVLIECVPNFSEGRDPLIIKQITDAIKKVEGVQLLDVDPGKATNRTVVTFVGSPDHVIEAAFQGIKKASEVIDMSKHSGEHPRMGATDVCPLIPISGISMEETAAYAHKLGKRVGEELDIPVYMYESAANSSERKNLATIRSGEYEGFEDKLKDPNWKPDYGKAVFNAKSGATAIGARDFLVAYNVNLNTKSTRRANSIAFDVRENGRVLRKDNKVYGPIMRDENGEAIRVPGKCKSVKAIGWYIEEYGMCQISMNLTNIKETPLHIAFEACRESANQRGLRVTGSELVGLVPKSVLLDAGKFYLTKQRRSLGVSEQETIEIAIQSLGLRELGEFDPQKKVIEYLLENNKDTKLVDLDLITFCQETASDKPAPGGGSISAYCGALGAALAAMVANLSANKRTWDDKVEFYSDWAVRSQDILQRLINKVDEDTHAFNTILEAFRMPKTSEDEKISRKAAIEDATKYAIQVPLQVMKISFESFEILLEMARNGLKSSCSDAGVGALCTRTAIQGAFLNVKTNAIGLEDQEYRTQVLKEAQRIMDKAKAFEEQILQVVHQKME